MTGNNLRDDDVATSAEVDVVTTGDDVRTNSNAEVAARLQLVVSRLHRRIRVDGTGSVPPAQLSALITIEQHGPLRPSEIARREALTPSRITRMLAALDERGLVTRSPDPGDARCVRFVLSVEGAARLAEARISRTASMERRLLRLDDQQRAALVSGLPSLEAMLVDE